MRVTTPKILMNLGLLLCFVLSINVPSISSQSLNLPQNQYTVKEGDFANVTICHDPQSTEDTTFEVSTSNGSAISGVDFLPISQNVTIPAGTECILQFISIYPDFETEGPEAFVLTVGTPQQIAVITITDVSNFAVDEMNPAVTCINDVMQETSAGSGGAVVQFTEPTATDNSDLVAILSASHRPGQYFTTGTTPVTYIFIDPSGNQGSCTFQVTVTEATNTAPFAPICSSVTETAQPGATTAVVDYGMISCFDSEDGVFNAECNIASGSPFSVGTHSVTCTCTDNGGQTSTCNFAVIVQVVNPCDNLPCQNGATCTPGLDLTYTCTCPDGFEGTDCEIGTVSHIDSCPQMLVVSSGRPLEFTPPSCYDNSGTMYPSTCSPQSGTFITGAMTTVTCQCSGQPSLQCMFDVTVGQASIGQCPQQQMLSFGSQLVFTPPPCYGTSGNFVETSTCTPSSGSVPETSLIVTCHCRLNPSSQCTFPVMVSQGSVARIDSCPQMLVVPSGRPLEFTPPSCYDDSGTMYQSTCTLQSGTIITEEMTTVTCYCSMQQSLQCMFDVTVGQDLPKIVDLHFISMTNSSITLRWTITDAGSDTLTCRANYTAERTSVTQVRHCSGNNTCRLLGLSSYTLYNITVECRNTAGYSNALSASVTTATSGPSAPQMPTVVDNSESCIVRWKNSEQSNGPGLFYEVNQFIEDATRGGLDESLDPVEIYTGTEYEQQKEDMKSNSKYTFEMCANNRDHKGECVNADGFCMTNPGAPSIIPPIETPDPDTAVNSSSVNLKLPDVDARNGPISCYEFVVLKRNSDYGSPDEVPFEDIQNEPGENGLPYRSVVMNHAEYSSKGTITIGSDSKTITRCTLEVNNRRRKRANVIEGGELVATNSPLESGINYDIFMRSYSETSGGMFQYTSSDYVNVTTTGVGPSTGLIVFLVVFILIVIVVSIVLIAVWFRYSQKKKDGNRNTGLDVDYANEGFAQGSSSVHGDSKDRGFLSYEDVAVPKGKDVSSYEDVANPSPLTKPIIQSEHPLKKHPDKVTSSTGYEETSFSGVQTGSKESDTGYEGVIYEEMPEDSNNYDQAVYVTGEAPLPVKISDLPEYVKKKRYQKNGLEREFKLLPQGQQSTWTVATKAENKQMNNIPNVLPYDHSRVKLTKLPGTHSSDYFNASFIMDQHNRQAFIAAQGPFGNTVQDFLRLIWQEKVSIVVMVTPVEDAGKKLCSKYWPSKVSGKSSFGNISVTLASEEHYPDYSIRQLMVCPEDKSATDVLQLHFTSWPYMGVPKKPTAVILFIRYIKEALQQRNFPVLVHCSDGSGATGTFIGAFCLMDDIETGDEIFVYDFVKKMRKNRVNMVQTKGQYLYLYDVLLQAYLMPQTELSAKQLKSMTIKKYTISKEFQALKNPVFNATEQSGASQENQGKNRFETIIPLDVYRPTLKCSSLTPGNNYVNACLVDGYRDKNALVMTQSPLPTTVEDFWRLVIDMQCSTIVMLNETDSSGAKSCVCYWPNGGNVQYGNILVTCVNVADEDIYVHRQFDVTHQSQKRVISVNHFQLQRWPGKNISTWRDFIRILPIDADAGPTIVHCVDGCGHSGVFITVLNELQRLREKQMVNVFETVQKLRDNNPNAMQTLELYTLCYAILQGLTYQT